VATVVVGAAASFFYAERSATERKSPNRLRVPIHRGQ